MMFDMTVLVSYFFKLHSCGRKVACGYSIGVVSLSSAGSVDRFFQKAIFMLSRGTKMHNWDVRTCTAELQIYKKRKR